MCFTLCLAGAASLLAAIYPAKTPPCHKGAVNSHVMVGCPIECPRLQREISETLQTRRVDDLCRNPLKHHAPPVLPFVVITIALERHNGSRYRRIQLCARNRPKDDRLVIEDKIDRQYDW